MSKTVIHEILAATKREMKIHTTKRVNPYNYYYRLLVYDCQVIALMRPKLETRVATGTKPSKHM